MGCFLGYDPEIPGIFECVGVTDAHFANASARKSASQDTPSITISRRVECFDGLKSCILG